LNAFTRSALLILVPLGSPPLGAADFRVDLTKERVGRPPTTFEPMVGSWIVVQDGADRVIRVDGAPWKTGQDTPSKLLVESARKLYGTSNEELMDNAKQFAYYPVAVVKGFGDFSNGTIAVKFKTIAGDLDRCSGIVFNIKANGDWLALRYNDTEHNVVLWEFHNGIRRSVRRTPEGQVVLDRNAWHELKLNVDGSALTGWIDGQPALEYTLGDAPKPSRSGAAPNPDLLPMNNPVLQPPVKGRIGLWSKTDSTSEFKDYIVTWK